MIFMYKAYKFRLYPNNNQLELINKFFGCNRFVYNYYLDKIKKDKYMKYEEAILLVEKICIQTI